MMTKEERDETVHNGVFCHRCFVTIDMTETEASNTAQYGFFVDCPNCGEYNRYGYDEVKPLENWKAAVKRVEARMDAIESKVDSPHFRSDLAKAILKEIENRDAKSEENRKARPQGGVA